MQRVIEALESRIAPAAVFSYTEADGDVILIKTSAKISDADFADYIANNAYFSEDSGDRDLLFLDLANSIFRNTSLTISLDGGTGDGLASIGEIYTNVDLKNVIIDGNLGSIVAGDRNAATPALSTLQVENLGGTSEMSSLFVGNVKAIKVLGDLNGGINADFGLGGEPIYEAALGNIGVLNVGGNVGSSADIAARTIGTLKVGGNVEGDIFARTLKSVRIAGDVVGGTEGGGTIIGGSIKSIRIDGSIIGGDAPFSGGVAGLSIGNLNVGKAKGGPDSGNIVGGTSTLSGFVAGFEFGKVTVRGSVVGGGIAGDDLIGGDLSGAILALGDVNSIRVDGDLVAGAGAFSGSIVAQSLYGIESLLGAIGGGDEGGEGGEGNEGGLGLLFGGFPLALGSIIGGEVGKIVVGGSLIGSQDVAAGEGTITVSGDYGGSISALTLGSLRIGGSIVGGDGYHSASVSGNSLTAAVISGGILGGDGYNSAIVDFNGIGSIRVVESVIGGTGIGSASIVGDHGIGSVKIGGALTGGAHNSGSIASFEGNIDSVVIGGAFSNGLAKGEGFTGIYAAGSIGRVTIGAGASGGDYGTLGIRAGADTGEFPNAALPAIGSVSIKGDASNLMIESGVEIDGYVNYWGSIGSVNITGNFNKSSISAGIDAGTDGYYGTSDDAALNPGIDPFVSRIASVVIGGTASGTPAVETPEEDPANLDSYGIFAGHIVALKVAGAKQTLTTGAGNDAIARVIAGDVTYKETPILLG